MQRPARTLRRRSRTWASGRGQGAGPGVRKPEWAQRPARRLCASGGQPCAHAPGAQEASPAPGSRGGIRGRPGSLGRAAGTPASDAGGSGEPFESLVTALGSLDRNRHTCAFCPQSQETRDPRSQACPSPTKSLRAPPRFFLSLLPPPRPAPEGMGVEPQKGAPCSPALTTITRFVRRENQPRAGVSADPCSVLGSQSPGEFRSPPATPSLSKPRNQSKRTCLGARLGDGLRSS